MKYWDSSALLPLLVEEPSSKKIRQILKEDSSIATWWGSPVECLSALWKRKREGSFNDPDFSQILNRFHRLMEGIDFVAPTIPLRDRALRLLALHSLRSGDILQLASALRWIQDQTKMAGFICLDEKLRASALAEGFTILP